MEAPLSTTINSYSINTAFNNPDVRKSIMSYLDCVSLALASRVCKQWHDTLTKDEYWTPFQEKHALSEVPSIKTYRKKKLVLFHFGLLRSKEIIRNKNDLVCRAEAFFAQQKWNQAAQFSCQMGPKADDCIVVVVKRNPHDKTLPQLNLHTLFYVDNGSANLNPLKDEPIYFESTLSSSSTNKGLYEYKRSVCSLVKEYKERFYSQILMPESLDYVYKQHFQRIVDRNLKRLVDEENSAHTKQTALRVATAGIAFLINQEGIYENCVESTPIVDLSAKETVSLSI